MIVHRRWIPTLLILCSSIACSLVYVNDNPDSLPLSEITPASTQGWVSFVGRGVRIAAPAVEWTNVPFDPLETNAQLAKWQADDPSVANVFQALQENIDDARYKLILMRTDGTATLNITTEALQTRSYEDVVQESKQAFIDQGIQPFNQRRVNLFVGEAIRWELQTSPPNSQILNREFVYIVQVGQEVYYLNFSAQAVDFKDYAPVFEAMAISFSVN